MNCKEGEIVLEGHLEDLQMKVSRLQNLPKPLEMKAPKHHQVAPQELQNQPHEKEPHKKWLLQQEEWPGLVVMWSLGGQGGGSISE